jgi:hypothetical protein
MTEGKDVYGVAVLILCIGVLNFIHSQVTSTWMKIKTLYLTYASSIFLIAKTLVLALAIVTISFFIIKLLRRKSTTRADSLPIPQQILPALSETPRPNPISRPIELRPKKQKLSIAAQAALMESKK